MHIYLIYNLFFQLKGFSGSPMEALEAGLMPFPYRVAKAIDPNTYR
jgi:hypothetical protein